VQIEQAGDDTSHMVTLREFPESVRSTMRSLALPLIVDATGASGSASRATLLDAAWLVAARDGLENAGPLVHAVLDLADLDGDDLDDLDRAQAVAELRTHEAGATRDALADRFQLQLDP
jgi:hypothetical protein